VDGRNDELRASWRPIAKRCAGICAWHTRPFRPPDSEEGADRKIENQLCCSSLGLGRSSTEVDLGPWYTSAFIVLFYCSPCLFFSSEERLIDSLTEISTMPATAGISPISIQTQRPPSGRRQSCQTARELLGLPLPDYKRGWKGAFIKRSVNSRLKSKNASRKTIRLVRSYRRVPCVGHCLGGAGLHGMRILHSLVDGRVKPVETGHG
jgi:hypothetical protein